MAEEKGTTLLHIDGVNKFTLNKMLFYIKCIYLYILLIAGTNGRPSLLMRAPELLHEDRNNY